MVMSPIFEIPEKLDTVLHISTFVIITAVKVNILARYAKLRSAKKIIF